MVPWSVLEKRRLLHVHLGKKLEKETFHTHTPCFFGGDFCRLRFLTTKLDWKSGLRSTRGSSACGSLEIHSQLIRLASNTGILTQTALPEMPAGIYLGAFILTGLKTVNLFQNWRLCISLIYNFKWSSLFSGRFSIKFVMLCGEVHGELGDLKPKKLQTGNSI